MVMGTRKTVSLGFIIKTLLKYIYMCCKKKGLGNTGFLRGKFNGNSFPFQLSLNLFLGGWRFGQGRDTNHFGIWVSVGEIYFMYEMVFSINVNKNQFKRNTAEKLNPSFNQIKILEIEFSFSFKT